MVIHTSSVPDLQLDPLSVQLNRPDLEINANGCNETRRERVLAESQETAGLADTRVAYQEELYLYPLKPMSDSF